MNKNKMLVVFSHNSIANLMTNIQFPPFLLWFFNEIWFFFLDWLPKLAIFTRIVWQNYRFPHHDCLTKLAIFSTMAWRNSHFFFPQCFDEIHDGLTKFVNFSIINDEIWTKFPIFFHDCLSITAIFSRWFDKIHDLFSMIV